MRLVLYSTLLYCTVSQSCVLHHDTGCVRCPNHATLKTWFVLSYNRRSMDDGDSGAVPASCAASVCFQIVE